MKSKITLSICVAATFASIWSLQGADTDNPAIPPTPAATAADVHAGLMNGEGPGWVSLQKEDFAQVNSAEDTWSWDADGLHCTGLPISVMRTAKEYGNVEMVVEWCHLKSGGNSGVFMWTTPESIKTLEEGKKPGLPKGIEVQILDHGYKEIFEKGNPGKKSDWFTSNGDVFAVGVPLKPFPPLSPNGSRSFPTKQLSKGHGQWNHYYIRAINGEVRLFVNGEEVSGGNGGLGKGYICLESEGSPIVFRKLRIRELP
jgi:hypothetical protein